MRLVTYNIRGGLGMDDRRSTRRIGEVLQEIGADIVCLQEVHQRLPWSAFRDQPGHLARVVKSRVVFQNNFRVGLGGFGNALLTSRPILSRASHSLPNARERQRILKSLERRGLLEVVVETPGGPLVVLVTHWSLDAEDRMKSAEEIAARVEALKTPVILAGDFNAEADSAEMQRLRQETGLVDAGAAAAAATFPADAPRARIDYVLHSPELSVTPASVVDTQASDHRPVVVDWT